MSKSGTKRFFARSARGKSRWTGRRRALAALRHIAAHARSRQGVQHACSRFGTGGGLPGRGRMPGARRHHPDPLDLDAARPAARTHNGQSRPEFLPQDQVRAGRDLREAPVPAAGRGRLQRVPLSRYVEPPTGNPGGVWKFRVEVDVIFAHRSLFPAIAVLLLTSPALSQSVSIPIPNYDFASPYVADAPPYAVAGFTNWVQSAPPAWWTADGYTTGQWIDTAGVFVNVPYEWIDNLVPSGGTTVHQQAAFMFSTPGLQLSQTLSSTSRSAHRTNSPWLSRAAATACRSEPQWRSGCII